MCNVLLKRGEWLDGGEVCRRLYTQKGLRIREVDDADRSREISISMNSPGPIWGQYYGLDPLP